MTTVRNAAAVLTTIVAATLATTAADVRADAVAPAPTPKALHRTLVTFAIAHCDGCTVTPVSARTARDVWVGPTKEVVDGVVSFKVPRHRVRGLTATMDAPWEGSTGYATEIAFRYGKQDPGDVVDLKTARSKKHASGCYAGTAADHVTFRVVAKKVSVQGVEGPTPGTIAWTRTTQPWLDPMVRTPHGVLGAQEYTVCG